MLFQVLIMFHIRIYGLTRLLKNSLCSMSFLINFCIIILQEVANVNKPVYFWLINELLYLYFITIIFILALDPPFLPQETLKAWQKKNHPWLELSDVHKETTENIRVTVIPFYMGSRDNQAQVVYWVCRNQELLLLKFEIFFMICYHYLITIFSLSYELFLYWFNKIINSCFFPGNLYVYSINKELYCSLNLNKSGVYI